VNVTNIHNTYNETVVNNVSVTKVSYNGGPGGTHAVPTAQERAAASEQHIPPTAMQHQHVQEAARNPALSARANGGHPAIAATPRPGAFNAPGVVGAHGASTPPGAAQRGGQPGQFGQNGAHAPGQPGQPNGAHPPGQPGQPNGAHPPGQPGQPAQAGAKPAKPPVKAQRPKPEEKKGDKDK